MPFQVIAALPRPWSASCGASTSLRDAGPRTSWRSEFGAAQASTLPLFSGDTFSLFTNASSELFSGFDVAWMVFAVYTAWRIPAGLGFGRMVPGTRRG